MKNYVQKGETIIYDNSTGLTVTAGSVVVIGSVLGVLVNDVVDGDSGAAMTEGVFDLGKTAGLAITKGDRLFYSTSTKLITKTVTDTPIGTAHDSALAGDSTVKVNIYENAAEGFPVAAVVAAVTTADATDLATAEALAIANKTAINAILTSLKAAGIMASA